MSAKMSISWSELILFATLVCLVVADALADTSPADSFEALDSALEKEIDKNYQRYPTSPNLRTAMDLENKCDDKSCLFSRADLRPAARALRRVASEKECSETVLDTLEYIASGADPATGMRRIDQVLRYYIRRFKSRCGATVEYRHKIYSWQVEPAKVGQMPAEFVESLTQREFKEKPEELQRYMATPGESPEVEQLIVGAIPSDVKRLAADDGSTKLAAGLAGDGATWAQSAFKRAFEKHVKQPCRYHNNVFEPVFNSLFALRSLYAQSDDEFYKQTIEPRGEQFKNSLLVYKRCSVILNLSKSTFEEVLKGALATSS